MLISQFRSLGSISFTSFSKEWVLYFHVSGQPLLYLMSFSSTMKRVADLYYGIIVEVSARQE